MVVARIAEQIFFRNFDLWALERLIYAHVKKLVTRLQCFVVDFVLNQNEIVWIPLCTCQVLFLTKVRS